MRVTWFVFFKKNVCLNLREKKLFLVCFFLYYENAYLFIFLKRKHFTILIESPEEIISLGETIEFQPEKIIQSFSDENHSTHFPLL